MTRLASWIIASPFGAALATLILGFSGVFSWAAAVPSVLVTLRSGMARASLPLVALLVVVALHVSAGEMTLAGTVLVSLGAAGVLGGSLSLRLALLSASAVSMAYTIVIATLASDQLDELLTQYRQAMELLVQSGESSPAAVMTAPLMLQLIGVWVCISGVVNLFIARSMQARLFNPDGFRQEFHGLRLTPATSALCMVPLLLSQWWDSASLVEGIGLVPVLISGLALAHGMAARKRWGAGPLVILYLGLFLVAPVVTPLLLMAAMADSFFDFRQKVDVSR